MGSRVWSAAVLALGFVLGRPSPSPAAVPEPALTADQRRALETVRADSLRGHLSFLASDALGGRETPSPSGDIAAEYVAARFRSAGLEPAGDDGYFQTIAAAWVTPRRDGFVFRVAGARTVEVRPEGFRMRRAASMDLQGVPVVRMAAEAESVPPAEGAAIVTAAPEPPRDRAQAREAFRRQRERIQALRSSGAALVVVLERTAAVPSYFETRSLSVPPETADGGAPVVTVDDDALREAYDAPGGLAAARLTLRLTEPVREPVTLRNVAGLLRGSDPGRADTYVLVSAHYDTTGPRPGAAGPDRIWNGANDDGSGTTAVIDLAAALSTLRPRPPRSILFLAFAAEEKGLRGSAYYAARPLVPLARTVADINLEHLGRTDSLEGDKAGTASVTGYDFSDLPNLIEAAGELTGIHVRKDPQRSDPFFQGSDNLPLAEAGVVAHTVCVLFEDFADYHGAGDEWNKIDYPNMEKTTRMIGAAVLLVAGSDRGPRWRDDPRTVRYREAAARRN
jgi:hypothetical protein